MNKAIVVLGFLLAALASVTIYNIAVSEDIVIAALSHFCAWSGGVIFLVMVDYIHNRRQLTRAADVQTERNAV